MVADRQASGSTTAGNCGNEHALWNREVFDMLDPEKYKAAIVEGPEAQVRFLLDVLLAAEATRDPSSIFDAAYLLMLHYAAHGQRAEAIELIHRIKGIYPTDPKRSLRFATILSEDLQLYDHALDYVEAALARARTELTDSATDVEIAISMHTLLAAIRRKLYLLAKSGSDRARVRQALSDLEVLARGCSLYDGYVLEAMKILMPSGVASSQHKFLLEYEWAGRGLSTKYGAKPVPDADVILDLHRDLTAKRARSKP
jgi:hypothetical protein